MYSTKKTRRQKKSRPRFALAAIIIVIALAAIGAVAWHIHTHKTPSTSASVASTNSAPKPATTKKGLPTTTTTTTGTTGTSGSTIAKNPDNTPPPTQGAAPKAPSNNGLVSNHRPSLSSAWGTNQEDSVCNTTPGAVCQITFTNNGVTKSLPSEQTDSTGAAYWNNWSLQSIGLTEGTWTIKATATLNGQTSTVSDPTSLEVQP